MKNIYIKKSLLILSFFVVSAFFVGVCNAEETTTVKQIQSVADFSNMYPRVLHTKIDTVLAKGILNAKVFTYFGIASYGELTLEYKVDDGELIQVEEKNIRNKKDIYIGTLEDAIKKGNEYVDYRIKGVFKIDGEEDFVVYEPADAGASSTTFVRTKVVNKIEKEINGDSGGTISVFAGDQSKGDNGTVIVNVPAGAYGGNHNVIVDFLDESSIDQGAVSAKTREKVISNVSVDVDGVSEISNSIQIKNLPLKEKTNANKFFMQYQKGTEWNNILNSNLSVNKQDQLYSFSSANLGHYRVLESITLSNSSYRPSNRIVVKAKIGSSYPGFEFKYLSEGDKITIYNLKGRKIRKISADGSSETTVWDGRRDNGDWAESGTYIYQIKLKDSGEVISGTIAFVW